MTRLDDKLARISAGVFRSSRVRPAIRANDTSDVRVMRGATSSSRPSRPFHDLRITHAMLQGA